MTPPDEKKFDGSVWQSALPPAVRRLLAECGTPVERFRDLADDAALMEKAVDYALCSHGTVILPEEEPNEIGDKRKRRKRRGRTLIAARFVDGALSHPISGYFADQVAQTWSLRYSESWLVTHALSLRPDLFLNHGLLATLLEFAPVVSLTPLIYGARWLNNSEASRRAARALSDNAVTMNGIVLLPQSVALDVQQVRLFTKDLQGCGITPHSVCIKRCAGDAPWKPSSRQIAALRKMAHNRSAVFTTDDMNGVHENSD